MKNKFYWLMISAFIISFASCKNDDEVLTIDDSSSFITSNGSHYVTYEQALRQAIQFLSSDDEESIVTRANRFVVEDHYEYVSPVATRSLSNTNFIPSRFHVINFANNGGFVVVAADNRATPIYAYSDDGYLDIEDAIEHTGFDEFMQQADENFQKEIGNNRGWMDTLSLDYLDESHKAQLPTVTHNGVLCKYFSYYSFPYTFNYLLSTEWGQGLPYCMFCGYIVEPNPDDPNMYNYIYNKAGCGPIAAAQTMAYHQYPSMMTDTLNTSYNIPWEKILGRSKYNGIDYFNQTDTIIALARLINIVGQHANAQYGTTVTTTDIYGIKSAFESFGYNASLKTSSTTQSSIRFQIFSNKPVYSQGAVAGNNIGHAWVTDGYRTEKKIELYYENTAPYNLLWTEVTDDARTYFHCNWGWNGNYNAYVLDFQATPTEVYNTSNYYLFVSQDNGLGPLHPF